MKIMVSAPNEVCLNGDDFLLTQEGHVMTFPYKDAAIKFLVESGADKNTIDGYYNFHYEVDSTSEAEDIISEAVSSFKNYMNEKKIVNFNDFDEWAAIIEAAQLFLDKENNR